jgi:hypothetical protein
MTIKRAVGLASCAFVLIGALYGFQKPFRTYRSYEAQDNIPLPPDYLEKTEWVFARLMYPSHPDAILGNRGFARRGFGFEGYTRDWREGGTSWTQDYPRADRHFAAALRRLTRIHVRSVEQPVNPDDLDDFFNWPWMNAGEMGDWQLTDAQVKVVREYLLRGGFFMFDDFWGPEEFARFNETMLKIFPEHPVVEIESRDPIFHTVYDLSDRSQIIGSWCLNPNNFQCRQRAVGTSAHWMGVYDDRGRVMIAISFNSDIGDSWEWADDPKYPENLSAQGIRIGVNDVVYAMTH